MQEIAASPPIPLGSARHAMAAALGMVAATARVAVGASFTEPVASRRVLILEPYGLGDAISLVPLAHGLLASGWQVTVCSRPSWREVFPAEISWVDCRVPWTAYDDRQKYRASSIIGPAMRSFLHHLRRAAAGSVGIDTRGDARSLILLWLARCQRVLTLDRYLGYDLANPKWVGERVAFDPSLRRWQSNLQFLTALEPAADTRHFPLDLRGHWSATGGISSDRPTVGLIPLAPWLGKLWTRDAWRTTVRLLQQDGWIVRGLAGPGQMDATVASLGLDAQDVILCPDLPTWARQLSGLSAVVSVDTGPMHLADALHVPLVALYGASTLPLWAPSSPRSLALHRQSDPDHRPVHPTGDAIPIGQQWMRRHSPEDVVAAVHRVCGSLT
ncbi:MAG: glycosyltransferase family 9 protein [Verrucomicrobiales bacterium]